jgi:molybdopterin-guanine dinucleotide biosynthesis protein A
VKMTSADGKNDVAAFILAGGQSSRMGRDKAMLEVDGVTMLDRTMALIRGVGIEPVVVGAPRKFARATKAASVIEDEWPGAGPLGGIASALRASQKPWNLVVACDLPYLTREWLEFLLARGLRSTADAVVPMNEGGPEPLCAMYAKCAVGPLVEAFEGGVRGVIQALTHIRVEYLERSEWKGFDSDGLLFKNMNAPADYAEAQRKLGKRAIL